jgi:hypothetical protein
MYSHYYIAFIECGSDVAKVKAMTKRKYVEAELRTRDFSGLYPIEKEALKEFFPTLCP